MNRLKTLIIIFSLLIFFLFLYLPAPDGLDEQGKRALCLFFLCLVFWTTNVIPLAITSLMAMALLPILNITSSKLAYSLFGSEAVFFILGAFILSGALTASGVSNRIALLLLSRFKNNPINLRRGIFISAVFLSWFMSEHAVVALIFPIVLEIVKSLKVVPYKSSYSTSLFLSLAWGGTIGGITTFLGGARNALAVGMLKENWNLNIGFFEWIMTILPLEIYLIITTLLIIDYFFKVDLEDISAGQKILEEKQKGLQKMSRREKWILAINFLTIISWIFFSQKIGLANISIIASVLLFLFNLVSWKDIEDYVNWGVILMYGGSIALGSAITTTNGGEWLIGIFLKHYSVSPFILIGIIAFISIFITEAMSNSAVVALVLPIAFSLSRSFGINPLVMVYSVAVPAGLSFCLPMGTPGNAICYSSGYYNLKDMIIPGIWLNFLSWIGFLLLVKFYWPLIGLRLQ